MPESPLPSPPSLAPSPVAHWPAADDTDDNGPCTSRQDRPLVPPHPEAAVTKKPRAERMPYRPMPPLGAPPSNTQRTADTLPAPAAGSPPSSSPPLAMPVIVRQSRADPLNTLGLGSLPSNHEGVVPDPLHAPVESRLDELSAADEGEPVFSTSAHLQHRSPSVGLTCYGVALPSFTRALAPGGSLAATPSFQLQGGGTGCSVRREPALKQARHPHPPSQLQAEQA